MKKSIFCFIFCVFLQASYAQKTSSLLWEISGNGLGKPSYLYGTIHHICKSQVNISSEFRNIIRNVDDVYLEINFNEELNDFKAHFDSFNKSGKKLIEYYSNAEYKILENKFNSKFRKHKLDLSQFSNYKPNEILNSLMPKIGTCDVKWTSYESEISAIAKRNSKPIKGIETYEEHNSFQVEHDSTISKNAQKFFDLITKKESLNELVQEYGEVLNLYLKEDVEKIYAFSVEKSISEEIENVIHFRNQLWIPRIAKFSKEKPVLYAVGAAHLGGEKGVINLLRKEGFTLKPIFD